jgi:4-hydroxybenzoyl-CoA thioesterase
MKTVRTPITVEWGDCDPAGIVFYPRFFAFFDASAWSLFYSVGLTLEAIRDMGATGFPAVDAQARFIAPCRLKDRITVTSSITEWREKTFVISHTIHNGDVEAVAGQEIRIWGIPHPEDPKRLKAAVIPDALRRRFEG